MIVSDMVSKWAAHLIYFVDLSEFPGKLVTGLH